MNNFKIQSLVLAAVIAMVYATPVKPPHYRILLGHIRDDAKALLATGLHFQVGGLPGIEEMTCAKEFFCIAEKSLEEGKTLAISNLTNHLKKYNEHMNITCNPTFNGKSSGRKLLSLIIKCATP